MAEGFDNGDPTIGGRTRVRHAEESLRAMLDCIPTPVYTMTLEGQVEFLNRRALDHFGKTAEELQNWEQIGWVHPVDLSKVGAGGEVIGFIGSALDVTEQVLIIRAELGAIINTIPGYVWCAAPNGEFNYLNQPILEYTGAALMEMKFSAGCGGQTVATGDSKCWVKPRAMTKVLSLAGTVCCWTSTNARMWRRPFGRKALQQDFQS